MATKVDYLRTLAEQTARSITWDTEKWTEYLRTAGKLYKYPFEDQLLIHAQRPQATAVADYDVWNKRMGRYVRRGTNGIALLDEAAEPARIRYVFDIADTGRKENSKTPYLWQFTDEHFPLISEAFEAEYQAPAEEGLALQIKTAAFLLSDEHWKSFHSDILRIVDKSSLGDYDEDTVRNVFSSAVAASAAYAALSRCELYPDPIVTGQIFGIFRCSIRRAP